MQTTFNVENLIYYSIIIVFIFEVLAVHTWNKVYFTKGLQIFTISISVPHQHSNIPSQGQLEIRFKTKGVTSSILFKELGANIYGFREKYNEFVLIGYTPVMHGILYFDFDANQVIIKGFINWFAFYFCLVWISAGIFKSPWPLTIIWEFIIVFFFGIIYWNQRSRYLEIAKFAAETWARKHQSSIEIPVG